MEEGWLNALSAAGEDSRSDFSKGCAEAEGARKASFPEREPCDGRRLLLRRRSSELRGRLELVGESGWIALRLLVE